jgi:hypothetical protein
MTDEESSLFSNEDAQTITADEQPELYKLAEGSMAGGGDGTFTYEGRLWQVHEGVLGDHLVITPGVRR